jgi:protein ImuB
LDVARDFSPRFERHYDDLVSLDISGLGRLLGSPRAIGEELRNAAAARYLRVHVAIAGTRTAALVLALARPGLTVVDAGDEPRALAELPIGVLESAGEFVGADLCVRPLMNDQRAAAQAGPTHRSAPTCSGVFKTWGLKTLGELAALPAADLAARLGLQGLVWQTIARGEDITPLVPTTPAERFESTLDLEWPIDGLEPLSFVLTRLLEPLCTRLERRDRGAAVLHVRLRLVSREIHVCSLQLPSPIRDVRTLRTLALLDLEAHPPAEAIDQVTVAIDPTPGRVLQHTLFTRPQPTPEQLSTLIARLGALMGQDRIGAPATVDSYRPGAFEMRAFASACGLASEASGHARDSLEPLRSANALSNSAGGGAPAQVKNGGAPRGLKNAVPSALRRCREPVPARVAVADGRPVRVTTDRRGFAGGAVLQASGPWRTSGNWWARQTCWNRDEWDVALSDGAVYRVFQDRETDAWFIDAIVD